jgi:glutathione synthase/RimK-type ligase-like ATP-grasp enzyme
MAVSKVLLVVDYVNNYYEIMRGAKLLDGSNVTVEQTFWKYLHVEATSDGGAVCQLLPHVYPDEPWPWSKQGEVRVVKPDFCLIRNFPLDTHGGSYKSQLLGLKFANLPSVNSLDSVLMSMERAYQYSELLKVQKKLGKDVFSVVPMAYFTNEKISLNVPDSPLDKIHQPGFPVVVKVGSAHAGRGKIRSNDEEELQDLKGVLAMSHDYYTLEPLVKFEFEYRIQKLGNHFRCFKRKSDGWKQNVGDLKFEDYPVTDRHKFLINECATMMGGLDICAIDMLHKADGTEVCLEINDTAIGIMYNHEKEDLQHIREVVLQRMNESFCPGLLLTKT